MLARDDGATPLLMAALDRHETLGAVGGRGARDGDPPGDQAQGSRYPVVPGGPFDRNGFHFQRISGYQRGSSYSGTCLGLEEGCVLN